MATDAWNNQCVALLADGTMKTWGRAYAGNGTAIATYTTPVAATTLTNIISIDVGGGHVLALKDDGTVKAWGANSSGQLGDGTSTTRLSPVTVSGSATGICEIAAGYDHSLGLHEDGSIKAWGRNYSGQLGDGTTTNRSTPITVKDPTGTQYLAAVGTIAAGDGSSFAVFTDGTAVAWGYNYRSKLGIGSDAYYPSVSLPMPIIGLTKALAVSANYNTGVASRSDGTVGGWGWGGQGQLGTGTSIIAENYIQTVAINDVDRVVDAQAGWNGTYSLFVRAGGRMQACGWSSQFINSDDPLIEDGFPPLIMRKVQNIASSDNPAHKTLSFGTEHFLAVTRSGRVYAYGVNDHGQLGLGHTAAVVRPMLIPNLTNVVAVSANGYHSMALKADGSVWTWGRNTYGELGDGTTLSRSTPLSINLNPGGSTVPARAIAAGYLTSFAVTTSGLVKAWGSGNEKLGLGINASSALVPTQVSPLWLGNVVAISTDGSNTITLNSGGSMAGWGQNTSGIIAVSSGTLYTPALITRISGVYAMSSGNDYIAVIRNAGKSLARWGANADYQLGIGTSSSYENDVKYNPPLGNLISMSACFHNLAVTDNGKVYGWGPNFSGALGDTTYGTYVTVPQEITF